MRVLRLDLGRTRVELHPFLTVVRGLAPELRQQLLDVMAGIPAGRTAVSGLIEAHGVILDLAPATLALLDLQQPLDVVIGPDDLPAGENHDSPALTTARRLATAAATARDQAEAALAEATERRDVARHAVAAAAGGPLSSLTGPNRPDLGALADARSRAEDRLVEATAAVARARNQLAEAERGAAAAQQDRVDATRAVSVAVAALETGSRQRDSAARAAVAAARRRLADAEARLAAARSGESAPVAVASPGADALRADRVALEAALLALDTTDPLPVRRALERLRSAGGEELVVSEQATELAERWSILEVDLRAAGIGTDSAAESELGQRRTEARRAVEEAERAVAEAEASLREGGLSPADIDDLEAAHNALVEAREASEKRFGGARAGRRIHELEAAEQEILDRVGFLTYSSYRMGAKAAGAVDDAAERLEAARRELAAAEELHRSLEHELAVELERAELLDRRRQLRAEAVQLLGTDPGDDVEGALRRHRVPASTTGEHLVRLRHALESTGLVLADEDVDERLLVDLARVWLSEQADTEVQREALQQQIAAADVELAGLEARERAPVVDEPWALAVADVQEAEVALRGAESRLARDAEVVRDVDALREAFEAATAAEEQAAAAAAAADKRVVEAAAAVAAAGEARRKAEAAVATATAAESAGQQRAGELAARVSAAKTDGVAAAEAELAACEAAVTKALAAAEAARQDTEEAAALLAEAEQAAERHGEPVNGRAVAGAPGRDPDDVEWYLLARLAAQRSVSYAGSVPLVLDDALAAFDREVARGILERLERMASTVQVVLVTEDLWIAGWAEGLGVERAHVTSG